MVSLGIQWGRSTPANCVCTCYGCPPHALRGVSPRCHILCKNGRFSFLAGPLHTTLIIRWPPEVSGRIDVDNLSVVMEYTVNYRQAQDTTVTLRRPNESYYHSTNMIQTLIAKMMFREFADAQVKAFERWIDVLPFVPNTEFESTTW